MRANVLMTKAVSGSFTGVAFGHYFVNGQPVSREEYLSQRRDKQGKPGKAERAKVPPKGKGPAKRAATPPPLPAADSRPNADLDAAMGEPPARHAPAIAGHGLAPDIRHNPALDDIFGEAKKPAPNAGAVKEPARPAVKNPATPPPLPKPAILGGQEGSKAKPPPLPKQGKPSSPPALPHERTQGEALRAANAVIAAARTGDRMAERRALDDFNSALTHHLRAGNAAIDRLAAEKYGEGRRAKAAALKAKTAFAAKLQAARQKLADIVSGRVAKSLDVFDLTPSLHSTWEPDMTLDHAPWRVKRIGDGTDDILAYLTPDPGFQCDGGKLVVHGTVTTDSIDPQRDVVMPVGGDLARHRKNPICLLNHRRDLPGIAKSMDPDGNYTVRLIDDHRMDTSNHFDQHSKLSTQSFRLIESGALGGLSPGFMPKPGCVHKAMGSDKHPVFVYSQWELFEITHAPIGMNGDAVVHAVEKGFGVGEALLPELKDLLIPYLPQRKPLVRSGWERPMTTVNKALNDDNDDMPPTGATDADTGAASTPLTRSTAFYHTIHAAVENLIGLIDEEKKINEAPRTKEDCDDMQALLGKLLDLARDGHSAHTADHPDQPALPDASGNDMDDETDEVMKAFAAEAVRTWARKVKLMEKQLASEELEVVREARSVLEDFTRDPAVNRRSRMVCKMMARKLGGIKGGVTPEIVEDEDWSAVFEKAAGLEGAVATAASTIAADRAKLLAVA